MAENSKKLVVAATFTVDFLLPSLEYYNDQLKLGLEILPVPYNQIIQQLIVPDSMMNNNHQGLNVILIRFADWLRFQNEPTIQLGNEKISGVAEDILETSYHAFIEAVESYAAQSQSQTLILIAPSSPSGAFAEEWQLIFSGYRDKLQAGLKAFSAIHCLDAEEYHEAYEVKQVYDLIGDKMGHIPYAQDYLHLFGTLIIRYYYGLRSPGRKVIVTDCDNTIWNGICGEAGAANINWDGDAGKLQQFLVQQSQQGILICLCSKNTAADVWEVFDNHPGMPLTKEHIVASRINWEPKSENIKALAVELNLGLDSFIFIDDNQVECSEVNINCPDVLTIHWPPEGEEPVKILSQLWLFDHFAVTNEDKERTVMYQAEISRKKAIETSGGWQQFIEGLKLEVDFEEISDGTLERASQLTMRTNQFNFTTIRRSTGDIQKLQRTNASQCYVVKAKDRFGTYGIVGLIILLNSQMMISVDTFLLSCRVLGRGVEHKMIRWIAETAIQKGFKKIGIRFQDSAKNAPARKFLDWLAVKYSGSLNSEGILCFSANKLLKCRYTDYSGDSLRTKESKNVKTKQSDVTPPVEAVNLMDFWLKNRTIELLTKQIDAFRSLYANPDSASNLQEGNLANQDLGDIPDSPAGAREINPVEAVHCIKKIFCKYTAVQYAQLTSDFLLENLSLDSQGIVSITSELDMLFHHVEPTLLFECQSFGAVCDAVINRGQERESTETREVNDVQNTGYPVTNKKGGLNPDAMDFSTRDIAIIGISCRYPGAKNIYEFWENLVQGKCSIAEIPAERWESQRFYSGDESDTGKSYNKWGGFIDDMDKFDAAFFKISPRQAALMDPQQRLLLEIVWNLLEDAGYNPECFEKKTGVFAGVISSDYGLYQNWLSLGKMGTFRNCDYYQIANRISYFFDFHGPSLVIDTACSASGTAVHMACESLLAGDCNCAIVGGVNLILHPSRFIQYSHVGMLSRDHLCRPFGDNASGTIIGEGLGALLLKPYHRAIQDADHIWGVIKGSAVNSGGRTTGFTVPNPAAQGEVVTEALRNSKVDPGTISYIEAHGTGTSLGDPIELKGLELAFQQNARFNTGHKQFCAIGSVKSNIGHLESGAAVAGIIKVLLQMKYRTLAPSLHAEIPNPKIDLTNSPFKIQHQAGDWNRPVIKVDDKPVVFPLRAGISSFGAGGSNAHIILEEPIFENPDFSKDTRENAPQFKDKNHLILLSAEDEPGLVRLIRDLVAFFRNPYLFPLYGAKEITAGCTIENIAYTLRAGRKAMDERLALVVHTVEELVAKLETVLDAGQNQPEDQKIEEPQDFSGIYRGRKSANSQVVNLISGNAGRAFIKSIVSANDMDKLAQYWIAGGEIPDDIFQDQSKSRRLSLPVYPFDGPCYRMEGMDRIIVSEAESISRLEAASQTAGATTTVQSFQTAPYSAPAGLDNGREPYSLFKKSWRKTERSQISAPETRGEILIVGGNSELNNALIRYFGELPVIKPRIIFMAAGKDLPAVTGKLTVDMIPVKAYDWIHCSNAVDHLENRHIGHVIYLGAFSSGSSSGIQESFLPVFAVCQRLMRMKPAKGFQFICVYPGVKEADEPLWGGICGFGKTVREENPEVDFRTVCVHLSQNSTHSAAAFQVLEAVRSELWNEVSEPETFYDGNEKWISYYQPMDISEREAKVAVDPAMIPHEGGTYLITGGGGGIGLQVAGYLASLGRCNIVLCGRSMPDEGKIAYLNQLAVTGAKFTYWILDISKEWDANYLIRKIKKQYGKIDGIFHCAGVIRDSFIIKKEKSEIEAVLASKVQGTFWLDAATRDQDLDFIVLFSSLSGVLGNRGQSDYAYANHFMDNFRNWRNKQVSQGKRKGLTIAVNWPYWLSGGMKMSAADEDFFTETTGLKPLPADLGIEILKKVLELKIEQAIPCYGDDALFQQVLNGQSRRGDIATPDAVERPAMNGKGSDTLQQGGAVEYKSTKEFLQSILGEVINMKPQDIHEDTHFETLGIDSIAVRLFSHRVEKQIGKVSRTLLYECHSLKDLVNYFLKYYEHQLLRHFTKHGDSTQSRLVTKDIPVPKQDPVRQVHTEPENRPHDGFSPERTYVAATKDDGHFLEETDIAIVGMSGSYPLAGDLKEYWQNLKNGRDCITWIPEDRWNKRCYFSPDPKESGKGKYYCEWGGFLGGVRRFDPLLFNIAPKEARGIDPQERLFLQSAWMALEDAGYNRDELSRVSGKNGGAAVGVFVGITTNDYQLLGSETMGDTDVMGHSLSWSVANRVSYCLNLSGPSIAVDGACSSSLMAVHLACESLKRGECDAAIVGAANLFLHPFKYILNSQQRMLSAKGRCFAFSAEADGFVPAEGVGAFLFKRLDKAKADGDHIYAVIKGTAVNHGGRSNGYMVPNPEAQAEVIEKALEAGNISPRTVSYLEAHGTGTILGDPIEIAGLTKVYQKYSQDNGYCSIGSVKSNIGHAEAAAGIASLTKVILQMRNQWIVPALYAQNPNPAINFMETPFFLQTAGSPWKQPVIREGDREIIYPRRAGISSFGAGGANAHIVVEEYQEPDTVVANDFRGELVFILSAMTKDQLREYAGKLLAFLTAESPAATAADRQSGRLNLLNLAYTLQVGREPLKERLAIIASTMEKLREKLQAFSGGQKEISNVFTGNSRTVENLAAESPEDQTAIHPDLPRMAQSWVAGKKTDWRKLYGEQLNRGIKPCRISLPTYPFSQKEYWITSATETASRDEPQPAPAAGNYQFDLTGTMAQIANQRTEFTVPLSLEGCEFLKAHILFGKAVLSGPTQLAMLFEAVYRMLGTIRIEIKHMDFIQPIIVGTGDPLVLKLIIAAQQDALYRFQFQSRPVNFPGNEDTGWSIHSSGQLTRVSGVMNPAGNDTGGDPPPAMKTIETGSFYAKLEQLGYRFEDSFKCITDLRATDGFSAARIINGNNSKHSKRVMEPGIIDSCIQMLLPTLPENVMAEAPHSIYVPVYVSGFAIWDEFTVAMDCYGKRIFWDHKKATLLGSLLMKGINGSIIGKVDKFRLKQVDSKKLLQRSASAATGIANII